MLYDGPTNSFFPFVDVKKIIITRKLTVQGIFFLEFQRERLFLYDHLSGVGMKRKTICVIVFLLQCVTCLLLFFYATGRPCPLCKMSSLETPPTYNHVYSEIKESVKKMTASGVVNKSRERGQSNFLRLPTQLTYFTGLHPQKQVCQLANARFYIYNISQRYNFAKGQRLSILDPRNCGFYEIYEMYKWLYVHPCRVADMRDARVVFISFGMVQTMAKSKSLGKCYRDIGALSAYRRPTYLTEKQIFHFIMQKSFQYLVRNRSQFDPTQQQIFYFPMASFTWKETRVISGVPIAQITYNAYSEAFRPHLDISLPTVAENDFSEIAKQSNICFRKTQVCKVLKKWLFFFN
ncbi:hypothetical protein RFI_24131 [Reticulomyxa filosa]|uniref:Uncharacterized protein n=1 Tax=Reticulomyxa filosa TaxID=46433 RepID=X6MIH0_RETFI|nr:hypothetical protein RFI_24131 [Reticulomyxa filosa]|eukprot:ETO13242.1 hypothetical protein RFI_24131 [Reticulomyxa filosa]